MKRVSKLFTGCLCILAMAIISCKDNDGGGNDELKASVNKAVAASVSIEEGAYTSIVKAADKEKVNAELDSAGIDKIIAAATDYSGFVKDNEDGPTYSTRAMSAEALGTKVSRELEEKITKFREDLSYNGKGSFSYSIAPGEITGLPNGIKMTIPLFFISNTAAASSDGTMAMTFTEGISSTYFADLKKTAPESIFKQSAVNSAQNYNYSISARITANSGNSMDLNGYAKINVFTSSWTSFITKQGIAGKISTELKVDINFTEFKEVFEKLQNPENPDKISLETFLNSKNTNASLVINVCDLEGKVIYNYKKFDKISDIDDYITFFDLSSKISPF